MKALILLSLLLWTTSLVGQSRVEIPVPSLDNGDTIFIKKVNYFEYNLNQFLLDTAIVTNGIVSFEKNTSQQQLINLSKSTHPPSTFLPLFQFRESYTSMFCSNFYSFGIYILIADLFSKNEYLYLQNFYLRFTYDSFDEKLFKKLLKAGDYKRKDFDKAYAIIEKKQNKFLEHLNKNSTELSPKFIEYIKTEIHLGALNQLLNYYEETHKEKILAEFSNDNSSIIHDSIYNKILQEKWNVNSIQYFRSLERIMNYEESKRRKKFQTYFSDLSNRQVLIDELINKTASNTK